MAKSGANNDLKNHIYKVLKDRLINCVYAPGSTINESQLAAEFELSRTPIREAVYRLEQDGLLQIMPKKGIYVPDITIQDVIYVFQTRIEIEPLTLRMAAPFLNRQDIEHFLEVFLEDESDLEKAFWQDMEMHMYFTYHCGNPFLIDMMHKVYDQSCRIVIASKQNQSKIKNARQEHVHILRALLNEEYDKACQCLRQHLEGCQSYSLNFFNSTQNLPSGMDWNKKSSAL